MSHRAREGPFVKKAKNHMHHQAFVEFKYLEKTNCMYTVHMYNNTDLLHYVIAMLLTLVCCPAAVIASPVLYYIQQ